MSSLFFLGARGAQFCEDGGTKDCDCSERFKVLALRYGLTGGLRPNWPNPAAPGSCAFIFQAHYGQDGGDIDTWEVWKNVLRVGDLEVVNEWGDRWTPEEFIALIETMPEHIRLHHTEMGSTYFVSSDGFLFSRRKMA